MFSIQAEKVRLKTGVNFLSCMKAEYTGASWSQVTSNKTSVFSLMTLQRCFPEAIQSFCVQLQTLHLSQLIFDVGLSCHLRSQSSTLEEQSSSQGCH